MKRDSREPGDRPTLSLITTGGTIGSRVDPATGGAVPAVSAAELISLTPGLSEIATIRPLEFGLLQSWNIGPQTMVELARAVDQSLDDARVSGAIVTHGTDTMEETAFALDLLVDSEKPVIMTGAMRNASEPDFDGPRNLIAAAKVAISGEARGRGAMVVMNGEIHAARFVMKTNTTSFDAFSSPERGAMGVVSEEVLFHYELAPLPRLRPARAEERVYLVKMAAGSDELFLRTLLDAGAAGVVLEGSGAGNVPDCWHDAIAALIAARIPVVLVSRCLTGRIVPGYGGRGGGRTLRDLGVIDGGWLSGPKARIALSLALGDGASAKEVRALFAALCPTDAG